MIVEMKLVKKSTTYTKEDGSKQRGTNLYLQVGNEYVPIEVVFFPNAKCEGRDPAYAQRMAILCAVAEDLPQKQQKVDETSSS